MTMHGGPGRQWNEPRGLVQRPGLFGRMFPQLEPLASAPAALTELALAMRDTSPDDLVGNNERVPAGYTYFGQFVDHDISFDPTAPSEQQVDPTALYNFRTPKLELDSLYGLGPELQPFLYERGEGGGIRTKLRVGRTRDSSVPTHTVPADLPNDLPRLGSPALDAVIGDKRNDENLAVAQMHVAFLKFHNAVVDELEVEGQAVGRRFAEARRLVTWHYQWIVLEDFVRRLVEPAVFDDVKLNGRRFYRFTTEPFIPVEFSVAAYRLGHSMVRNVYSFNRFFRPGEVPATLELLFRFSGLSGADVPVPSNWVIDWRRFFDLGTLPAPGFELNHSRRLDPFLAPALHDALPDGGLARMNLLRGLRMQLPSGQRVAKAMGLAPLAPEEINRGPDGAVAARLGFDLETPLWYYVLKEAEQRGGGLRLGPVGSRILAEVFWGLLDGDPLSFRVQEPAWRPELPAVEAGRFTMADLLRFVGDINPTESEPPFMP